jgi:hypothetical protein
MQMSALPPKVDILNALTMSPVPVLLMRRAVISDWKFFSNNEDRLGLWARRYGESAAAALADELRRFPWQARCD